MNLHEIEELYNTDIARAFRKLMRKYVHLRNTVIIAMILLAIGCGLGLHETMQIVRHNEELIQQLKIYNHHLHH